MNLKTYHLIFEVRDSSRLKTAIDDLGREAQDHFEGNRGYLNVRLTEEELLMLKLLVPFEIYTEQWKR